MTALQREVVAPAVLPSLEEILPPTLREPLRRAWLPFTLPSFNDLENARGRVWGRGENGYNALKRKCQQDAVAVLNRMRPVEGRVVVALRFFEASRHRDPDGVASAGAKILLDALGPGRGGQRGWPGAGVLHCDGWHCLACPPIPAVELAGSAGVGIEVLIYGVKR